MLAAGLWSRTRKRRPYRQRRERRAHAGELVQLDGCLASTRFAAWRQLLLPVVIEGDRLGLVGVSRRVARLT
jgi:hypothetical protein